MSMSSLSSVRLRGPEVFRGDIFELQAAYPNGGAALAALPPRARAFETSYGTTFIRSANGTRWENVHPITLYSLGAESVVNTGTTEQSLAIAYVPPGMVGPSRGMVWRIGIRAGTNASYVSIRWRWNGTQLDVNSLPSGGAFTTENELRTIADPTKAALTWSTSYVSTFFTSLALDSGGYFSVTAQPGTSGDSVAMRLFVLQLV